MTAQSSPARSERERQEADLQMIRDSINNARANLDVAIDAADRSKIGNRLAPQGQFSAVNARMMLRDAHDGLRSLEGIWAKVSVPGANLDSAPH